MSPRSYPTDQLDQLNQGGVSHHISGVSNAMVLDRPGYLSRVFSADPTLATSAVFYDGLILPANVDADVSAGGGLADGLYRYRLASVHPSGEMVASPSSSDTANSGGGNSSITVTWDDDPEALEYRLYRSDTDGLSGTEYLLAIIPGSIRAALVPNTFVDDGSYTPPDSHDLPLNQRFLTSIFFAVPEADVRLPFDIGLYVECSGVDVDITVVTD